MSKSLVEKNLFAYTFDHFQSLKALLNCFKEKENYEFYENDETDESRNRCIIYFEEQDFMLNIYFYPAIKSFHIFLEVGYYYSRSCLFYSFHLFRKNDVHHHLKEIFFVWTRLNLKYKTFV